MPRNLQEIVAHADELASQLDDLPPGRDARLLRGLRKAVIAKAAAESKVAELVDEAHAGGHTWSEIGAMLGTSGEAARQRYGAHKPM